jgi:hypothetical protein
LVSKTRSKELISEILAEGLKRLLCDANNIALPVCFAGTIRHELGLEEISPEELITFNFIHFYRKNRFSD